MGVPNRQVGESREATLLHGISVELDRFTKFFKGFTNNYVPTARTITINGVTYDLSQDRTWTVSGGGGSSIVVVADYASLPTASTVPDTFYWVSTSTGIYLTGLYYSNGSSWEFSPADNITVVANYSALPAVGAVTGLFYWCSASQGTSWLPGSLGGTYYSAGLYYSNGVTWEFLDVPYQATQAEVNTGTNTDKFVTPSTLNNSTQWGTVTPTSRTLSINSTSYDLSSDRSWSLGLSDITTISNTTTTDIEITDKTKGIILKSPDDTRWRIQITNLGELTATAL